MIREKHLIRGDCTLVEALHRLNEIGLDSALTLFATDDDGKIIGTVTDGDIRRSLVRSVDLNIQVREVANAKFRYLCENHYDVIQIRQARSKGIELLPVLDNRMHLIDVVDLTKQESYLPVDAVVMAGGKGERLRPMTATAPKPLLKIGGKCIIDYSVERLIKYGVRHISVTVNYLKEQLEFHFTNPFDGVKVNTVREPEYLGTIGSMKLVGQYFNDIILLTNSDIYSDINYEDFYLHFVENDAEMSIAAIPYTISVPYGIFELDGCEVKGIQEKPTYHYYANAGIYLIRRGLLDLIPDGKRFNATDFVHLLIEQGHKVIRFPHNGTWIDIGSPQEFKKADELLGGNR